MSRTHDRLVATALAMSLGWLALPSGVAAAPAAAIAAAKAAAPAAEAAGTDPRGATTVRLEPWVVLVGGVQQEWLRHKDGTVGAGEHMEAIEDHREDRAVTLAMSRFGLRGSVGARVEVHSEFEVSRGPHGTSVWEGQAALQVRDQWLRLKHWRLSADLGRITDEATVDFTSGHVADQLLADPYTQIAMLESGYCRGNGLKLRFAAPAGLTAGLAFHAANPTSVTASYLVAGKFSNGLYTRLQRFSGSRIASSPSKYPDDAHHMMVLAPSVAWRWRWLEAQAAMQLFSADLAMTGEDDDPVEGWNLRAGLRAKLLDGLLTPFANVSRVAHTTLDYKGDDKAKVWEGEGWVTTTMGGGLDVNPWGRSGVGVQLVRVHAQQGDGSQVERADLWWNIGATWWIDDSLALGARLAMWATDERDQRYNSTLADWEPVRFDEGERSVFVTLRKVLQ